MDLALSERHRALQAELRGFIPGTTTLVVADPDEGSTIDLATGETAPLDLPEAPLPEGAVPGRLRAVEIGMGGPEFGPGMTARCSGRSPTRMSRSRNQS